LDAIAKVASKIRLRLSRCASEPNSDSVSTDTGVTSRGWEPDSPADGFCAVDDIAVGAPSSARAST